MRQQERNTCRKLSANPLQQDAREFKGSTSALVNSAICRGFSGWNGDHQIQRAATKVHGAHSSSSAIVRPLTLYDNLALIKYLFRLLFRYLAPCSLYTMGAAVRGEAIMNNVTLRRIARPTEWSANQPMHPAVVQACLTTSRDERIPEIAWEEPTADEWRRGALAIAKQVALHIAGYRDHDEFTREGCLFAWNVFETPRPATRCDH
jgi:hypothetical protein